MTTIQAAAETAVERPYLRLWDAMREALGEGMQDDEGGTEVREVRVASRVTGGIRLQRCGGGVRVIHRTHGRAY